MGRARRDARQGKSASTQAGEFVREEIEHIREGNMGLVRPNRLLQSVFQKPDARA
jgi:hypothetical protein